MLNIGCEKRVTQGIDNVWKEAGMLKRIKSKLKSKKGMTMSSVLVAFAVLLLILLMFWQAVTISSNIFRLSEDIRKGSEKLFSDFYSDTSYLPRNEAAGSPSRKFLFRDKQGGGFELDSDIGSYKNGEYEVYYFGQRK